MPLDPNGNEIIMASDLFPEYAEMVGYAVDMLGAGASSSEVMAFFDECALAGFEFDVAGRLAAGEPLESIEASWLALRALLPQDGPDTVDTDPSAGG